MSLSRELLRTTIRTLAFPAMLSYVLYKMYLEVKDRPGTKTIIEAYRKLYKKIRNTSQKAKEQPHDQDEWSYRA